MSTIYGFSQLWTTMTLNVVLLEIKLILTLSVNRDGWTGQQELVLEVVCAPSFCQTRSICLWKLSISNLPSSWKFYIGFLTHTHRDYGEGSYNVIKDGKEAIQGGKSEALKLLLLISLQITFQSKNENQSQIIRYIYHNRYATVIKGICSEEERMFDNLL